MLQNLYHYKATVKRVIDGDTFVLDEIDLGFGIVLKSTKEREWKVRMLGIDTKELKSNNLEDKYFAYEAKDYMADRLVAGTEIVIKSNSFDNFGRILADVWLDGECLNKTLLDKGYAVEFMVNN